MVASADPSVSDETLARIEEAACPTCGSCSGMFTANSMNCLTEAIGLALPGQRHHAGHARCAAGALRAGWPGGSRDHRALLRRRRRFRAAARGRLPRRLRERDGARRGHGRLDQHDPAPARRCAMEAGASAVASSAGTTRSTAIRASACTRQPMSDYGRAEVVRQKRAELTDAYAAHPERFVRKLPEPPALPTAVWINEPKEIPLRHSDSRRNVSHKG